MSMIYITFLNGQKCATADDTTFSACNKYLGSLINRLEHDSLLAIEWCQEKCHHLVYGYNC